MPEKGAFYLGASSGEEVREAAGGYTALDQLVELGPADCLPGEVPEVVGVEQDDFPALTDSPLLGRSRLAFLAAPGFRSLRSIAQSQPESSSTGERQEFDHGHDPCIGGVSRKPLRVHRSPYSRRYTYPTRNFMGKAKVSSISASRLTAIPPSFAPRRGAEHCSGVPPCRPIISW